MPRTKARLVSALYIQFLEEKVRADGRRTKVSRVVNRGEIAQLPPAVEARCDARGSLAPISLGLGEEAVAKMDAARERRHAAYVSERQTVTPTAI